MSFPGAGIGGAARHGINIAAVRLLGFLYGTVAVNIAGSLILGRLAGWSAHKSDPGQAWRLFLTTGILGSFTMFSTFSLDTAFPYERGELGMAGLYVAVLVGAALAGLFAGLFLIRTLS